NGFVGCVCHRSKPGANFFVRQMTKNCSSATKNGRTKITRNASVRFNFNNSACSARSNDIKCSSLRLDRLTSCQCQKNVFQRTLRECQMENVQTMVHQQSIDANCVLSGFRRDSQQSVSPLHSPTCVHQAIDRC